jgi:hypothetical protein
VNFPHLTEAKTTEKPEEKMVENSKPKDEKTSDSDVELGEVVEDPKDGLCIDDLDKDETMIAETAEKSEMVKNSTDEETTNSDDELGEAVEDPIVSLYIDELDEDETTFVKIPRPGLNPSLSAKKETRLAPNLCCICLSNYEVGEKVVWSSNPLCEHVFHHKCIQSWIMMQKDRFLCACCRRPFIAVEDVLDILDEEVGGGGGSDGSDRGRPTYRRNSSWFY